MYQEILIAASLLVLLIGSVESGYRFGRRAASAGDSTGGGQVGAIQGAALGLLALLLGFTFSGSTARFLERQDLIVQEANAIGTAYLRADLLDEPHRSGLRASLSRYVDHRVRKSENLRDGLTPEVGAEISNMHDQIWKAASAGVMAKPAAIVAVLTPVNDAIDFHATRLAAGRKHVPALVMGLLIVCSAVSMSVIGYGCGLAGRRSWVLTNALATLVTASLWITIDLDHPRAGLIQLNDLPLRELKLGSSALMPVPTALRIPMAWTSDADDVRLTAQRT